MLTLKGNIQIYNGRTSKFFISKKGSQFYAICLWSSGERMLKAPGQKGTSYIKKCLGFSQEDALQHLKEWAHKKFGLNTTINITER